MKKEIYTPMEKVLIEAAKLVEGGEDTKQIVAAALETKENFTKALELDLLLLEMEEKMDLIEGIKGEEYLC